MTEDRLEAIRQAAYSGPDAEGAVRLFGRDEMRVVLAALAAVSEERDAALRGMADASGLAAALTYWHAEGHQGCDGDCPATQALAAHRSLR